MEYIITYVSIVILCQSLWLIINLLEKQHPSFIVIIAATNFIPVINVISFFSLVIWLFIAISSNRDNRKIINILCTPSGEVIKIKKGLFDRRIIKWDNKYRIYSTKDRYKNKLK